MSLSSIIKFKLGNIYSRINFGNRFWGELIFADRWKIAKISYHSVGVLVYNSFDNLILAGLEFLDFIVLSCFQRLDVNR